MRSGRLRITAVLLWAVVTFFTPAGVSAQADRGRGPVGRPGGGTNSTIELPNPIDIADPRDLIGRVIGAALGIVGSIAFAIFLWGGFLWMTSGGSAEKIGKGKNVIAWAAIGLLVIFTSYTLVKFVLDAATKK